MNRAPFKNQKAQAVPQAPESEIEVLGGLLQEPSLLNDVAAVIEAESFYSQTHREIFRTLMDCNEDGTPIGLAAVTQKLRDGNKLDMVGGPLYLSGLIEKVPSTANLVYHAHQIANAARTRHIIQLCRTVEASCYSNTLEDNFYLLKDMFYYMYLIQQKACQDGSPLSRKELETIIDSTMGRISKKEISLAYEVREWVSVTMGYFSVTDCDIALRIVTKQDKTNRRVILHRLVKEGVLERNTTKEGYFRRLETQREVINFKTASKDGIELYWPFMLERYFRAMPKNVIIIAGEPDAGKTAFLLNFMYMNMGRHKINYFSSEMGDAELQDRLQHFDIPITDWPDTIFERSSNFSDVIEPDAINVIDFLEITKDFYLVSDFIKNIFDRLKKGIAVIAIQKNRGMELGLGGGRSIEKARLYLSMGHGKIQILKCKNWADTTFNPNRLELNFKLAKGCRFIETSEWRKPGK